MLKPVQQPGRWLLCSLLCLMVLSVHAQQLAALDKLTDGPLKQRQKEQKSLIHVLEEVGKNYGVNFFFNEATLKAKVVHDATISGEDLDKLLQHVLPPLGLKSTKLDASNYLIEQQQPRKKVSKVQRSTVSATGFHSMLASAGRVVVGKQEIPVMGNVTSQQDNEALPGANVLVKGTTTGTVTDVEGNYSLQAPEDGTLVFSSVGFLSQEVAVNNQSVINVTLQEDVSQLEEIVVVGYGEQKKVSLTGSIASVKTEDINNIPAANLSNTLAGRAPGVQVVGSSGLSGASSNIRIRGSFGDPLYVINGILTDKAAFDALDANEVESINFLKDAATASIYGSTAGNGVVLVRTKSGVVQKPTFEYKGSYSQSRPTQPIQDFTATEEIRYVNNMAVTAGQPEPYGQEVLGYFSDKTYNINDLIWQNPTVQQHNVSVRGGSEDITYYFMLGYHTEEGSYKNLAYDRYNFRSDITANISEYFKVHVNLSGNQRNYNRWYWPYDGAEDFGVSDFFRATFNWTRLYPFYVDAQGTPTNNPKDIPVKPAGGWHPPQLMLNEDGYRDTKYRNLDGIIRFDLDLSNYVDGLSTSVQGHLGAYDRNMKSFVVHNKYYIFQPGSATNIFLPGPVDLTQTGSHNLSAGYENVQEDITLFNSYQLNWFLNYQKTFGQHDISALAVYEQAGSDEKSVSGRAEDLLSSSIDQIYNASGDTERRWFSGGEGEFARASWIGRVNYGFAEKYIAEFSFRYDGNYKFASDQQWGFFPSVSAGWRVSEEGFMSNIPWLSNLKLRGSYGTTGSDGAIGYDDGIPPWLWNQTYQKTTGFVFGNTLYDGLTPGALPNSNITWSTVTLWNAGLEFGFLNNRLSGEVDVWGKNESDILGTRLGSTPTTLGASLPAENYAERSWNGVELSADWRDQIGDVSYSMYANMGYAVDQWDIYDEAESLTDGTYADNWRSRIGKPADRVEGYISQGMIRTEAQLNALPEDFTQFGREPMLGTLLFEDIRGDNFSEGPDGKIDENDLTYLSNNGAPRINYGFGFNIAWKGLAVNTLFQGVGAYDRMISTRNGGGVFQVDRPYFEIWANDYWTPEHPEATYPRIAGNWMQPEYGGGPSSFWLRNGAYLRLKNINIGYTLPRQWYDAIGISTIQLFVNGTNLLVISDLTEHDPEQETLDSYPLMKTFTGGLTIQF